MGSSVGASVGEVVGILDGSSDGDVVLLNEGGDEGSSEGFPVGV